MVSQFNPSGSLYGGENYFASVLWDQGCLGLVRGKQIYSSKLLIRIMFSITEVIYSLTFLWAAAQKTDPFVFEQKCPFKNFKYSLRPSSPGPSGGGAGKGRKASTYVSGIWISASKTSMRNTDWRRWHKYIRPFFLFALIGNLIAQPTRGATRGWNSHSGDVVASSPSFSSPATREPWRTCSQVTWNRPFPVAPSLCFKARLCAKLLIWLKIGDGQHMTPTLSCIGSYMTFRASL